MADGQASPVTELLDAAGQGDTAAREQLWQAVYTELRQMAQHHMANEAPGRTLQPTALVHEAYFRLMKDTPVEWSNRKHFFGAAAKAMRRILIDDARRRGRLKRGGDGEREPLTGEPAVFEYDSAEVLAVHEVLDKLEAAEPRQAEVVMLRYFAGLSVDDTAQVLGISPRTVDSDWRFARAWLYRELSQKEG